VWPSYSYTNNNLNTKTINTGMKFLYWNRGIPTREDEQIQLLRKKMQNNDKKTEYNLYASMCNDFSSK